MASSVMFAVRAAPVGMVSGFAPSPVQAPQRRSVIVCAEKREDNKAKFIEKQAKMDGKNPIDYVIDKVHLRENEPSGQNWGNPQNAKEENKAEKRGKQMFDARRNTVGEIGGKVNETASSVTDKIQDAASDASEAVSNAVESVKDKLQGK